MTGAEYLAFFGASVILALTPGPDTFLTLRFGAHHVRAGLVYTVAVALGVMVWAVLALTGVAVLLEQFPGIRVGLTWIGGSYLMYLGLSALYQVRRSRRRLAAAPALAAAGDRAAAPRGRQPDHGQGAPPHRAGEPATIGAGASASENDTRKTARSVFRTGVISSLTNPKTGLFFLALLPPFLPQSPSLIDHGLLVATVAGCILAYGALLSVISDRIGRLLTNGSGPVIIDTVAGAVLIVLGITVVLM